MHNATGPVTKEERHAATKIMDRIMEHTPKEHGQRVAYLQSNSGGKPKRFVWAAQSETENPSDRSKRRKNQSIMATVVMVAFLSNCLVQPERITINQTLLDFASSRDAIAAGVQSKQRLQTGEDDLDYLAFKMNLSLGQVITLVSLGKHRFGFKFGQTIGSHKQGKKERRVDKLYSTERTIQKDGKIKVMNFMRVRSVGDMVAQKISMMKAMGAWKEWNLGDEDIPHGAAFVSPVVSAIYKCMSVYSPSFHVRSTLVVGCTKSACFCQKVEDCRFLR